MSSLDPVAYAGSWDQVEAPGFFGCTPPYLPLASRPDVLVFQTAPLRAPLQVVGPVEADLWVATDGPDTDFTAKLIDVHPPSADYPARLRDDPDRRHPAAALRRGPVASRACASPAKWCASASPCSPPRTCSCPATASGWTFRRSNFPKFDVNPNTGEPEGLARRRRIAVNTVFVDSSRPSKVVLPLLPL